MTSGAGPDYRFARTPRWVISHLLVVGLVIAMIVAGLWQLDRHGERGDRNELIEARSALAPVPVESVISPDSDPAVGDSEQFRQVIVRGEYQPEDEVLIRNRTFDGAPGWWVLTPLVTEDGWAVAVNRGWISISFDDDQPRPGTEAPSGVVEVVGSVQPARVAQGFQVSDPEQGTLSSLGRPDVARLQAQVDYPLAPVVVQVDPTTDVDNQQPIALPLPALDAGPHLSYAGQWFVFTTIALVGYPLVLRRVARGKAVSAPDDDGLSDQDFDRLLRGPSDASGADGPG